jgi:RIO-like serine/threonine protein kinase
MESLDGILEQIRDAQWHNIDEITQNTSLPHDTLNKLLLFLQEQEFIDKKYKTLRITSFGLKYLQLPVELPSNPANQSLHSKSSLVPSHSL